jgi:hypothetical protein
MYNINHKEIKPMQPRDASGRFMRKDLMKKKSLFRDPLFWIIAMTVEAAAIQLGFHGHF